MTSSAVRTAGSPCEGGLHVERQQLADFGNLLQKLNGLYLAEGFKVGLFGAHFAGAGVVAQGAADLHGQLIVQRIDQIAHVVQHIAHVQPFAAAEAGIENLLQIFAAGDDHVVVRQRAMAQVIDRADLAVGLHDLLGQLGQLFAKTDIGGHGWGQGSGGSGVQDGRE